MKLIIRAVVISLLVTACAQQQSVSDVIIAEEAGIYIYRPNAFSNVVVSPVVLIDNEEIFEIENNKYTFVKLASGKHTVALKLEAHYQGDFKREFELAENQQYFMRVDTTLRFVEGEPYVRRFDLNVIEDDAARKELVATKYVEPVMPSKYLLDRRSRQTSVDEVETDAEFSIKKTSDPFARE